MRKAPGPPRRRSNTKADLGVGYGRPPASGRFKPGQSGNPKGRKKALKTVGQGIDETLTKKVTIDENGRRITLTLQDMILRKLAYSAARGEMTAVKTLFALKERYQGSTETEIDPAELDPNDRAIIDYLLCARYSIPYARARFSFLLGLFRRLRISWSESVVARSKG